MHKFLFLSLLLAIPSLSLSAQRKVPRIDIDLADALTVEDIHRAQKTWRRAEVKIDAAGVGKNIVDSAKVRGRGNSTWAMKKKPYRFKFDKKQAPFGLAKGKSWVLLANYLGSAQLNNAIAMEAAQIVGTVATNHMIPVQLYINKEYRGLYNFSEQVGISANSVKIKDESKGALIELDSYKGKPSQDAAYHLPISIKDPDSEDYVQDYGQAAAEKFYTTLYQEFNRLTRAVKQGDYDNLVDLHSLATYYFVFDLTANLELRHPKSVYLYKENLFDDASKWIFGPVWDFDWAYGYENSGQFGAISPEFDLLDSPGPEGSGLKFFQRLFASSRKARQAYYKVWKEFMTKGGLERLLTFIDDYEAWIRPAVREDFAMWHHGTDNYKEQAETLKLWLQKRAEYIYAHLDAADDPDGLLKIDTHPKTTPTVYNLGGKAIATPASALPTGIYVIGGKKTVVP